MQAAICACLLLLLCHSGMAQPGSLDATFGVGAKVLTDIDQTPNVTNSVLVQPDGKIIVVGYCSPIDYTGYFAIARYNKDGTVDTSFGSNGFVTTSINDDEDIAFSAVLQPDGKVIAAGYTWTGTSYDFAMVRYNSDGSKDLSFGTGGIVTTNFYGDNDKANQILLSPDGDIFLVGYTGHNGFQDIDMAFAKFNPDGVLNPSFGNNGQMVIPLSSDTWDVPRSAVLQPDGKLIATGFFEYYDSVKDGLYKSLIVLRLDRDGRLDQSFGNLSVVIMSIGEHAIGTSVVVNSEGEVIVLGETKAAKYGTTDFVLLKFSLTGAAVTNFGNNGIVTVAFDNSDDSGTMVLLQPDQKILAAGYTAVNNGSTVDYALARFNANGSLDNSFGTGGKVTVDFQGGLDFGGAIALQTSGKIIMAGAARVGNDFDFGLVRLNNDYALPVKLGSFHASSVEANAVLEWRTFEETNSNYFEVQKSVDAVHWQVLDRVTAGGNTTSEKSYVLVDTHPYSETSYYRLKMVDVDQSYTFSSITAVNVAHFANDNSLVLFPNPTSGMVSLSGCLADHVTQLTLTDAKGNMLKGILPKDKNLDLRPLANGVYHIAFTDDTGLVIIRKIILRR